jgi:hypothetical protein
MTDQELQGEQSAREAAEALEQTLSLAKEADAQSAQFRRYINDNHWADKARRLWAARLS